MKQMAIDVWPELDENRAYRALGRNCKGILKRQSDAAIRRGIVSVGDPSGNDVSNHVGIVRAPRTVVVLGDYRGRNGIKQALLKTARALAEITRVLVQQRGQNRISPEQPVELIGVGRTEALGVTLRTLTVAREVIFGLVQASDSPEATN